MHRMCLIARIASKYSPNASAVANPRITRQWMLPCVDQPVNQRPSNSTPLAQDVYGKQILPVFPLKPVNKVSLGDFGTKRFVDVEQGKQRAV